MAYRQKAYFKSIHIEFMLIGSRQRIATHRSLPCLEMDRVPIDKVSQAMSLGIYFDLGIFRLTY